MNPELRAQLITGLHDGSIVPYLGPGVLADVTSTTDGRAIPATSEQLILAMNGGKPMAPKLMYEFPRAAMNVELKRGRAAVTRFLQQHLWRNPLEPLVAARLATNDTPALRHRYQPRHAVARQLRRHPSPADPRLRTHYR